MRQRLLTTALACCACIGILLTSEASGQEAAPTQKPAPNDQHVIPHRQSAPPNKPYPPQESLRRMSVPEGFEVELVAAEPDIVNPIAMCFDDGGRVFITESVEYPRKPAGVGRDRVKVLEGFKE